MNQAEYEREWAAYCTNFGIEGMPLGAAHDAQAQQFIVWLAAVRDVRGRGNGLPGPAEQYIDPVRQSDLVRLAQDGHPVMAIKLAITEAVLGHLLGQPVAAALRNLHTAHGA